MPNSMIGLQNTTTKFASQLAAVASALAGPRTLSGMSSTDHNQLIPCQPTAKKVQNMKRNAAMTWCVALVARYDKTESTIKQMHIPADPNMVKERRPQKRSMPKIERSEAMQNTVAQQAPSRLAVRHSNRRNKLNIVARYCMKMLTPVNYEKEVSMCQDREG